MAKKGRYKMFEDSYLCEVNIEAASIMIDREWEKSRTIKNSSMAALYAGAACFFPYSVLKYWSIIFYTHGGC